MKTSQQKKYPYIKRKLGELLIETGLISTEDLEKALVIQKESNKRLGQILVGMKLITEEEFAFALAMQLRIPYVDLTQYEISQQAIKTIPEDVSRRFNCVPLSLANNILDIAMADPIDLNMLKDLQFITGYNIRPILSTASQILDTIQKYYHPDMTISDVANELNDNEMMEFLPDTSTSDERDEAIEDLKDSPFIKMVDLIIRNAIKRNASDVHIEAQENHVRVRNRIDGVLQDSIKLPRWTHPIIISRIKILSSMDIAEKRLPQDGRIRVKARNTAVDLRVSTLPTYYGEKAVIRILNKEESFLTLRELGFSPSNLDVIHHFISQPQGMILFTGPTGSGKTSSLYACMREIQSDEMNIITVEDPVEYELRGINQVQIHEKIGLTFPFILRSILRQDPDVIMIGEIRDEDTAEIALQASLTGHLVLSTLHTNDAPSAVTRLFDIGMPAYLIASSVIGIVAQRLVRKICPDCKEVYTPLPDQITRLGMPNISPSFKFYHGTGCQSCNNLGYKGRTVIEEVMVMGRKIRELVQNNASTDSIREAAMASGMQGLGMSGQNRIEMGITTIDEVLKAAQQKEKFIHSCPHCGQSVNLNLQDCPFCKKPLIINCGSCNRVIQPGWSACPFCGVHIKPTH